MTVDSPLLRVTDLAKSFGGVHAVDGVSFDVAPRSVTALIGPNGAGKTTAFHLISGFLRPNGGSVVLDGNDITGRRPHVIARSGMVRTFQITKALTKMSVDDNLRLAAPDQAGEGLWNTALRPRTVRRREEQVRAQAADVLTLVGLAGMGTEYAGTLSGGQRKLLELGRALMTRPRLLLLDEPMAGVNPTLRIHLLDLIERLRNENGMTVLFIEHDMDVVMTRSDRVIVMATGRVIADGAPDAVRSDPAVIDAYLGAHR